jgi:polysaccharide deacetylase family protein (PEP-CTERM system associated)
LEQNGNIVNYLSIDVEDYFHVSAFESVSPPGSWCQKEMRVVGNTEKILSILSAQSVKATFFVLGWVAERCPDLVRRIAAEGHEVASHGYGHQRLCNLSQTDFREDIRSSKQLLEDLIGQAVVGYRAPSYSISRDSYWAFDELCEAGYLYDSSIFPIQHDFYGISDWCRFASPAVKVSEEKWEPREVVNGETSIMEVPISTVNIAGKNFPIAGGGYFRLLPYAVTHLGLQKINQTENQRFVFYLHPWEFDPDQPRMQGAGLKSRFRHYLNLHKTEERFWRLLADFRFGTISRGLQIN